MACVNDFRLLRKVCLYRFGGAELADGGADAQDFLRTFLLVFRNLRDEYDVSDRSCAHFYRLARARALLQGRDGLVRDDCKVLGYCGKDARTARDLPGIIAGLI
jgi:hypothetical protein